MFLKVDRFWSEVQRLIEAIAPMKMDIQAAAVMQNTGQLQQIGRNNPSLTSGMAFHCRDEDVWGSSGCGRRLGADRSFLEAVALGIDSLIKDPFA